MVVLPFSAVGRFQFCSFIVLPFGHCACCLFPLPPSVLMFQPTHCFENLVFRFFENLAKRWTLGRLMMCAGFERNRRRQLALVELIDRCTVRHLMLHVSIRVVHCSTMQTSPKAHCLCVWSPACDADDARIRRAMECAVTRLIGRTKKGAVSKHTAYMFPYSPSMFKNKLQTTAPNK